MYRDAAGWGVKHTISMYSIAIPTWMIPFLYAANQAESTQLAAKSFWHPASSLSWQPLRPRKGRAAHGPSRIRGAESASAGCLETAGLFSQRTSRNATCRALVLRQIGFASLEKQESRSRSNRCFFGGCVWQCLTRYHEAGKGVHLSHLVWCMNLLILQLYKVHIISVLKHNIYPL